VAQGECLGRAGRVRICQDDDGQVWVGGQSVTCIQGTALL
jgi:predicted PhzF superfamily epimerase YddE/YHI9